MIIKFIKWANIKCNECRTALKMNSAQQTNVDIFPTDVYVHTQAEADARR